MSAQEQVNARARQLFDRWLQGAIQANHVLHPAVIQDTYGVCLQVARAEYFEPKEEA